MANKQLIFAGRRETVDRQTEHNWTEIDTNKFSPEKRKNIFIFGGNNTDNPTFANGYAKGIETLLDNKLRKETDIISFYYATEPFKQRNMGISQEYEKDIERIYEKMIRPFLYDQYGRIKKVNGFENTFKNIVFVAHCGGSNFLNLIIYHIIEELSNFYDENTVLMMLSKLQIITYAPNELIPFNVNALSVMPTNDVEDSWARIIKAIQDDQNIDNDYPKGFVKKCLKPKYKETPGAVIMDALENNSACLIKQQKQFFVIPDKLNPRTEIGDHSFECLYRPSITQSSTPCGQTANVVSNIAKLFLNSFMAGTSLDGKTTFNKMVALINEQPPSYTN